MLITARGNNKCQLGLKWHRTEVAHRYLAEVDEQLIIANSYSDGFQKGCNNVLFSQVTKKSAKGKSIEQIVEELEEDVETIRPIYEKLVK